MNPKKKLLSVFVILFFCIVFFIQFAFASEPIAKITSFEGEVIIFFGEDIIPVLKVGQVINEGCRIQTKQGEAKITFNDGAVIKLSPYTDSLIQERKEEKKGIFKRSETVRRITCFIGKLWFKSGTTKRRNYLQTPTAVCGIRGSEGDIGYDNLNTYLNIYEGEGEVMGKVVRGFFWDPGIYSAQKSKVYQTLRRTYEECVTLAYKKCIESGKGIEECKKYKSESYECRVLFFQIILTAAEELMKNPDEQVASEAKEAFETAQEALENLQAEQPEGPPPSELPPTPTGDPLIDTEGPIDGGEGEVTVSPDEF